jgi:hypothetical protein
MAIKFDPLWNKSENLYDKTGEYVVARVPNHESSLNEAEMTALCKRILRYVDNMEDAAKPEAMDDRFWELSHALQEKDGAPDVTVRKGVHQRDSKAHFTLQIVAGKARLGDYYHSYHVFVAAGGINGRLPDPVRYQKGPDGEYHQQSFFMYRPTGIGVTTGGGVFALWPAQFRIEELELPLTRPRRTSFSLGNTTGLLFAKPTS